LFLTERVLDREIRTSRHKKKSLQMTVDGEPIRQTLGIDIIKVYVVAIVDPYSFQKSKGLNLHPTPRGEALNRLLRARKTNKHKK